MKTKIKKYKKLIFSALILLVSSFIPINYIKSENSPNIKILVAYHKKAPLISDSIYIPIHAGREVASTASKDGVTSLEDLSWLNANMIGDDTGDNISKLNRYACEMTVIYWAWKNYNSLGNPKNIGFSHYRRLIKPDSEIKKYDIYVPTKYVLPQSVTNYSQIY